MNKLSTLVISACTALALCTSCNSDGPSEGEDTAYGVAIRSFKLNANAKVLAHLDSVFFSISLPQASIFNADSLPYGTNITKLVPSIETVDYVSALEIYEPRQNQSDTIHNYLKNPEDTIDFSYGGIKLRVVSADGMLERFYNVSINVHQIQSDSLVWSTAARRNLPSSISTPTEQKTSAGSDLIYCLTRAASTYCLAYCQNPVTDEWTKITPSLPEGANVNSFTAAGTDLYILANEILYKSTDNGLSWQSLGLNLTNIYGALGSQLLANRRNDDGSWSLVDIASGETTPLPDGMPVADFSNMVFYKAPFGLSQQAVIAGGVNAYGTMAQSVWCYDGTNWAPVNTVPLDWLGSRPVIVPFVNFIIGSNFVATQYPTLLAFGGVDTDGNALSTVYQSRNYGLAWQKAPSLMQLPPELSALKGAQAFVYSGTLTEANCGSWGTLELNQRIPTNATLLPFANPLAISSRATEPITQWECPFIVMFGGHRQDGNLMPYMWRATFNRLTFKPIQ